MKAKVLKSQFNEMCLGGMILDMNYVSLYSGLNKMNAIEVNQNGINIQSEIGMPIVLNSPTVYGPGFMYMSTPADFVPFAHAFLPRKSIAPISNISDQFKAVVGVGTLLAIAGALS
tara:strand:- start:89 stop:436 length:348 start_codon:yes stop_codon:yes gene_type:complete